MADATYTPLVYMKQGGAVQVVASGGEIKVESGGTITNDGTQASHITALASTASGATIAAAVNSALTALEGIGVLATS